MVLFVAAVATVVGAAATAAVAQCRLGWKFGEQQGLPGLDFSSGHMVVFDDGSGEALYVGGGTDWVAGNVTHSGIAKWDGSAWSAVGDLADGRTRDIMVHQGSLIASGWFTLPSGETTAVIRLENGAWVSIGEGLAERGGVLGVFRDRLLLTVDPNGGRRPAHWIYEWDGNRWARFGPDGTPPARRFVEYRGELFALMGLGGAVRSAIAKWNGQEWEPFGEVVGDLGMTLASYQDKLLVGGVRSSGRLRFGAMAAWDGERWSRFGGEVPGGANVMEVIDGRFYLTGFDPSRPTWQNPMYLATWTGTRWQEIGKGLLRGYGNGIIVYDGELIVSSVRDMASGAQGLARFIGESWEPLGNGFNDQIRRFGVHQGELYAYGEFGRAGTVGDVGGLARWDGARWHPVGSGHPNNEVHEFATFGDDLIAVGAFTEIGGIPANHIARWDGVRWSAFGTGANAPIRGATMYNGGLVVVGEFTMIDGTPAEKVAIWDGQHWQQLGSGFDDDATSAYVHENTLFVGGEFRDSLAGTRLRYMARWDDTQQWVPLQLGLNGWAKRMASFRGDLVLLSRHRWRGGRMSVSGWNGSEWYEIGSLFSGDALDLAVYKDELYITGDFYTITGAHIPMQQIARWDGRRWRSVGEGLVPLSAGGGTPRGRALAVYDGELVVGGRFMTVEGQVNAYWARWGCLSCYADCDDNTGVGVLDIWDYICFQRSFINGESYACACDTSTGPRVCDIFDFLCFQNAFIAGCP